LSAEEVVPCCAPSTGGYLEKPLPALDDEEGARVPEDFPAVVDAHVHLFPDRLFDAIWRWFDRYGWPIRHKLYTPEVIDFLLSRGVGHLVAFGYAHKPGVADSLNQLLARVSAENPRVTALAAVHPGEPDARGVLERAFALGLCGVKIHCHVQSVAPDAEALEEVYTMASAHGLPVVIHAGREPKSPGYACDPHAICSAERVERVLGAYPRLRLSVPHLGADEFDAYGRLLERFDNLYLDTTMAIAGYFPDEVPFRLLEARPERVMYGTDFPNIPYAWDRELRRIAARGLREEALRAVLGGTARELFGIA
jgi:uncharacterized protein